MNMIHHGHITKLVEHRSAPCLSFFMPTHRAGRERREDLIRYKNLVGSARQKLLDRGDSSSVVDDVIQPLHELRSDDKFWKHRADGLACFAAPEFFKAYRLPMSLAEGVHANDRFHIRPLLPLLRSDARLNVLALTRETARLLETTRFSVREIELPDIPRVEIDGDDETLQYHGHRATVSGKGNSETAIYHGHGGPEDRAKKDVLKFF